MNKCCVVYNMTYFFESWNIDSERFPIGTCEVNRQVALVVSVAIITCGQWWKLTSHLFRRHARIEVIWAEKSQVCNPWISSVYIHIVCICAIPNGTFCRYNDFICLFSLDDNFAWNYFFVRIFSPWYISMYTGQHGCSKNFPIIINFILYL